MSRNTRANLVAPIRDAAVQAAWAQWAAIGFGALGRSGHAMVDPEALVLGSLAFGEHERRLERVMLMWLGSGSHLLSVGRLSSMLDSYPASMAHRVAQFAAEALDRGDARWKRLAKKARQRMARAVAEPTSPDLRAPAALLLRLRLALGVGIKADALGFLLGRVGVSATVREIASSTSYYERAVRRALEDLVAARLLETRATSPVSFYAKWSAWEQLLGVDENTAPLWRWWHELYVVAHALVGWADAADTAGWNDYVAASRLRDEFVRLSPLLARGMVQEAPDWDRSPEEWVAPGAAWVRGIAERIASVL